MEAIGSGTYTAPSSARSSSSSLEEILDGIVPCACCEVPVLISMKKWSETDQPAGVCYSCWKSVPVQVVRALLILKQQVVDAHEHIRRLYSAQQDVEEALRE